ncbi:MAG: ATPase [Sedimenticola sp.]|uniref:ATPase n=1 Tax=Sedimenticola thiotaurini TaxID=1543721 RepID=A0A558CMU2_9GAMM|nr:ATPase [Sedimenticola sp.]TVT50055.1 MAG: ATPase [Sedimenticola thiotaurini]MCW8921584.1 ATPase [Sedimenticola sp.]MCW8946117.1 ATPase [Sedimenticola sp.]MCW8949286.1 ATPase [Sedimenticola sp.]
MDETLQRLLDAEKKAEAIVHQADEQREQLIQGALREAHAEEERFEARIPELHSAFIDKAEQRATQTISELKKRYDEHHMQLRSTAESREAEALSAAFELLIDPDADHS